MKNVTIEVTLTMVVGIDDAYDPVGTYERASCLANTGLTQRLLREIKRMEDEPACWACALKARAKVTQIEHEDGTKEAVGYREPEGRPEVKLKTLGTSADLPEVVAALRAEMTKSDRERLVRQFMVALVANRGVPWSCPPKDGSAEKAANNLYNDAELLADTVLVREKVAVRVEDHRLIDSMKKEIITPKE